MENIHIFGSIESGSVFCGTDNDFDSVLFQTTNPWTVPQQFGDFFMPTVMIAKFVSEKGNWFVEFAPTYNGASIDVNIQNGSDELSGGLVSLDESDVIELYEFLKSHIEKFKGCNQE